MPAASGSSVRRVGIIAPMPSELGPVVKRFGMTKAAEPGVVTHRVRAGDVEVVAATCGIGTERAARTTTALLDAESLDHVMVVGIAGGIGTSHVGDTVLPAAVRDHATGAVYSPEPLHDRASGTIVTSDEFLIDPTVVAALVAEGVVALDMETSAIARVSHERGVPWSAVRAISDRADDHTDKAVLDLANADGSPNVGAGLRFLLRHPRRIPAMVRLAQGSTRAANAAAREAATQVAALTPAR